MSIGPLEINLREILNKNWKIEKFHSGNAFKMASAKWRPFCPREDELRLWWYLCVKWRNNCPPPYVHNQEPIAPSIRAYQKVLWIWLTQPSDTRWYNLYDLISIRSSWCLGRNIPDELDQPPAPPQCREMIKSVNIYLCFRKNILNDYGTWTTTERKI